MRNLYSLFLLQVVETGFHIKMFLICKINTEKNRLHIYDFCDLCKLHQHVSVRFPTVYSNNTFVLIDLCTCFRPFKSRLPHNLADRKTLG